MRNMECYGCESFVLAVTVHLHDYGKLCIKNEKKCYKNVDMYMILSKNLCETRLFK